ncbi:MAG: FtsX-like permease family protein [Candidatus Kapabacteria bacterium]|nr:FtsX-like permease family protein [Candidatus Kapabacteria bacterium]
MNIKLIRYVSQKLYNSEKSGLQKFSSKVAFFSVALGSMGLIIALSVLDGFDKKLHDNAIKFTKHIRVSSIKGDNLYNIDNSLKKLSEFKEIKGKSILIEREVLIKNKDFVDGGLIRSYNPTTDLVDFKSNIKQGSFSFSSNSAKEVVIGEALAQRMNAKIGDNIIIFSIKAEKMSDLSNSKVAKLKVIGIYSTGMTQYDNSVVFTSEDYLRNFLEMPVNSANAIEIVLYDYNLASSLAGKIEKKLAFPHFAQTVFDFHQGIFTWIEIQKKPIPIVLGLISIVAALNVITTLLITVIEKTKTVGILKTLGMSNRNILSVFLMQGATLGALGTALGSSIGFLLVSLQDKFSIIKLSGDIYFLDTAPVDISLWHYEVVIFTTIIISLLATIVPSLIVLKVSPVQAIKFR